MLTSVVKQLNDNDKTISLLIVGQTTTQKIRHLLACYRCEHIIKQSSIVNNRQNNKNN